MNCCRNCHWWDRDDDTVEDVCLFGPLMIKIPYSLLEENDCINYMDNSEMQLKNRIKELEIQLDKYVGMCANCPDLGNGYFALEDLTAQAAAMREALEWMKAISYSREDDLEQWPGQETREIIDAALASDAGRELLERLRKAEVERVEVYPKYGFCRVSGCAFWENDKCGRGTIACMAARFHDYLRDHDMIREAE